MLVNRNHYTTQDFRMITRRNMLKLVASTCCLAVGCSKEQQIKKGPSMTFRTIKIAGEKAVATLMDYRSRFSSTGEFPFLIGDEEELTRIQEATEFNDQDPSMIVKLSLEVNLNEWITGRRSEAEEFDFSADDVLGQWPGEIKQKGSIGLHKDVLTGKIKRAVILGIAAVEQPWQLPAVLKYGAWNECPDAEVHCAFHRRWQEKYGAQITGMSSDVVECVVANPPKDQAAALQLAWQQYWYCADIVDQGCGSINNLAAILINSRYWYFWWD